MQWRAEVVVQYQCNSKDYNRGQKGLRIFETLCDFGPVVKTRATVMAHPLSPRPMLFVLG